MKTELSVPQQKFADGVLSGLNQSEAYRRAYPRAKLSVETAASRLAASVKVCQYMQTVRLAEQKRGGLSRQQKREILSEIATSKDVSPGDRVRALQVDNRMTGDDAPMRVEGEITLNSIFQALVPSIGLPADED